MTIHFAKFRSGFGFANLCDDPSAGCDGGQDVAEVGQLEEELPASVKQEDCGLLSPGVLNKKL